MSAEAPVIAVVHGRVPEPTLHCPGCGCAHRIYVHELNPLTGCRWRWNGDLVRPTFTPSINIAPFTPDAAPGSTYRCHFTVTAGRIVFHGDCTHALRGRTLDLSPWPSSQP